MYLGNSDIELLLLAAWCKNLPSDMNDSIHFQVLNPSRIELLNQAALTYYSGVFGIGFRLTKTPSSRRSGALNLRRLERGWGIRQTQLLLLLYQ